jgi:hypothetical protein
MSNRDLIEDVLYRFRFDKMAIAMEDAVADEFRTQFNDILENVLDEDYFAVAELEEQIFQEVLKELNIT